MTFQFCQHVHARNPLPFMIEWMWHMLWYSFWQHWLWLQ